MTVRSERKETGRIETFSDGVFAIAITLLVLGLEVPPADTVAAQGGLAWSLLGLWPHYLAFATSFFTILAMWVNHHRLFSLLWRSDHVLLYLNGFLLLCVTFVPFPTTVLADYLERPEGSVAGALFAGTMVVIALVFRALWSYASYDGRLLAHGVDVTDVAQITHQHRFGPPAYAVAFGLSFISVGVSVVLCLCLAVFFGFKGWPTRH